MGSPEVRCIVPVIEAATPESRVSGSVVVVALLVAVVPRLIFVPDGIGVGFGRIPVSVALVTVGIALIALRIALIVLSVAVVVLRSVVRRCMGVLARLRILSRS
jgi:hypothetical protein